MLHTQCPCCLNEKIEGFYAIKQAPIYSLVTVSSRDEALSVPRKDIELAFCHTCGFIFNRLYDTGINYFTMGYEDQQGFSATFMAYLTRISKELIGKYHLENKTLLEIGCGKGDFINLLNELAGGEGIGVDPAYEEGRQNNPGLAFYREFYSLDHGRLSPDFICCRHTLEHIFQTREFLSTIRSSLEEQNRPVVFLEIPQITKILESLAFWDVYYEHCSYFSAGSLGRLLRQTGFQVLDLRHDYNELYLLAEARPANNTADNPLILEETVEEQWQRVLTFKEKISQQLYEWRQRLQAMKDKKHKVVIWGGGSKSVGFLTNFYDLQLIDYVVDINPNMENNFIPGIGSKYVQPDFLKEYKPDSVVIMNGVYRDEITRTIKQMGLNPDIYAL